MEFLKTHRASFWFITGLLIYILILIFIYIVLKFAFHKRLGSIWLYLTYFTWALPFWMLGEITAYPRKRKKWLVRSGLNEGHKYLEEGIGIGTSPIMASKIVGSKGIVYALDNHPLHIAILFIRCKIRRIRNIKLILSDASETGLENNSIDTIFICDAFDEFPEKRNTAFELFRILKPGGKLSILSEAYKYADLAEKIINSLNLFRLVERDGKFIKFVK